MKKMYTPDCQEETEVNSALFGSRLPSFPTVVKLHLIVTQIEVLQENVLFSKNATVQSEVSRKF
jgi:hypothetical protein